MRDSNNIRKVEALGIDWMGFIFYEKSPRNVTNIPNYLPDNVKRVGVFVDADKQVILQKSKEMQLDMIQLHGNESYRQCSQLKETLSLEYRSIPLIKVFHLNTLEDLCATEQYSSICDYYLFDTPCPTGGGSGNMFDWQLLNYYKGETPFILSGGIGLESIPALRNFKHPQYIGIDINSCFETIPAIKDTEKIELFIKELHDNH